MTQKEMNKAFENVAKRTFWNGDLRMVVELDRGMWGKNYDFRVEIDELNEEGEEETNNYTWNEQELLAHLNGGSWEMDGLTEEQKIEVAIDNMPEADPISETTYTTKSGYVMRMFLVQYDADKSQWYEIEKEMKARRGWYDRRQGGYMMRTREDAERLLSVMAGGRF